MRIPIIFEHEGEAGFRDREAQMIAELASRRGVVLATGGGAVLRARRTARCCAPMAPWSTCARARTTCGCVPARPQPPAAQTRTPRAGSRRCTPSRDPLYREVADFIIETGKPSVAQLANMVLMQLEIAGFVFPPAGSHPGRRCGYARGAGPAGRKDTHS